MSSFCLHSSPEALAPLGNTIVDNPLIHSHQTSFLPYYGLRTFIPDLNPVNYKVWSVMQKQVYHTPIHDVNDLKQRLLNVNLLFCKY